MSNLKSKLIILQDILKGQCEETCDNCSLKVDIDDSRWETIFHHGLCPLCNPDTVMSHAPYYVVDVDREVVLAKAISSFGKADKIRAEYDNSSSVRVHNVTHPSCPKWIRSFARKLAKEEISKKEVIN